MSLYGGIDLHANNSVIVLLNEQDEVIYQKRLPNALPTILEQLAPYHTEVKGLVLTFPDSPGFSGKISDH
jgi:transposase